MAPEILEDLRAALPGVSDAAIYSGLATRRARALLTEAMSSEDTFAGQWFDWGTGTWHVASTTDQLPQWAADRAAVVGLSVEAQPADFTFADLYATYKSVIDAPGETLTSISIDARLNRVVVRGSSLDADDVKKLFGGRVELAPAIPMPTLVPASCVNRWSCTPPLAGGVNIASTSTSTAVNDPGCSIGFTGKAVGNSNRYVYTAGHCITAAQVSAHQKYYQGSHLIGDVRVSTTSSAYDVALVAMTAPYWLANGGGYIQTSLTGVSDVDYAITSMATISVGDVVCEEGRSIVAGSDNCGVLFAENPSGKPQVQGLKTCHGDSGGSVFLYFPGTGARWAYGLVSTANIADGYQCTANGGSTAYMSFSAVPSMNSILDFALVDTVRVETR